MHAMHHRHVSILLGAKQTEVIVSQKQFEIARSAFFTQPERELEKRFYMTILSCFSFYLGFACFFSRVDW